MGAGASVTNAVEEIRAASLEALTTACTDLTNQQKDALVEVLNNSELSKRRTTEGKVEGKDGVDRVDYLTGRGIGLYGKLARVKSRLDPRLFYQPDTSYICY